VTALRGVLAMTDRQTVRLETFVQTAQAEHSRVSGPNGSAKVASGTTRETGDDKDGMAGGVASAANLANLSKSLAGLRLDLTELFVFVEAMATLRKAYATARQAESEAKQAAIACARTALMNQAIAKFVGSLVQAVVQIGAAVYSLRSIAAFTKAAGNAGQKTLNVDMLAPKTPAAPAAPAPGTSGASAAAVPPAGSMAKVTGTRTYANKDQHVNVKVTRDQKGTEAKKSDSAQQKPDARETSDANETMITNTRVNELNNLMTRLNLQSQIANGVGTALKAIVDLVADLYNAEHMVWTARAELCSYRYDVLREAASNALENQIRMQAGLSTLIGSESSTAMMLISPRA
jgi:hypothetical protein